MTEIFHFPYFNSWVNPENTIPGTCLIPKPNTVCQFNYDNDV